MIAVTQIAFDEGSHVRRTISDEGLQFYVWASSAEEPVSASTRDTAARDARIFVFVEKWFERCVCYAFAFAGL